MGSSDSKKIIENFIQKNYLPSEEQSITIKEVWPGRHRVNVWEQSPPKIVKSFFIRVENGEIIYCNPKL